MVAGWGKLSENGDTSDVLRKVMVPVISDARCQQSYRDIGYTGPITNSMICAGYSTGGKDACQVQYCTYKHSDRPWEGVTYLSSGYMEVSTYQGVDG